jgi:hypothetical protein
VRSRNFVGLNAKLGQDASVGEWEIHCLGARKREQAADLHSFSCLHYMSTTCSSLSRWVSQ